MVPLITITNEITTAESTQICQQHTVQILRQQQCNQDYAQKNMGDVPGSDGCNCWL